MASKEVADDDFVPTKETWRDFLYDSDKGTVLGRTGLSWFKIGVFYAIFYACLACWFTGLLHAFYSTLDDIAPTYYGVSSLLQNNPAMGVRPMPVVDSTMIRFAQGKESSYRPYTDHLEAFFDNYAYNKDSLNCTGNDTVSETRGCNIFVEDGLKELDATRDQGYGYFSGQPVVALKMNKLFDFLPEAYASEQAIKDDLRENEDLGHLAYAPGKIGVSCNGANAYDSQNIKKVDFWPSDGIDLKYFPYKNQKGYRAPIVLAKFSEIEKRVTIQVTCKVWATNIDNTDGKEKRGSVHFEFYIN